MSHQAILLPGIVLPAALAYSALLDALGRGVEARAKELEVYGAEEPPDYGLETELAGILREAERAGFERFHLVGYSGGGAISAAFAACYPDRLLSLALLEPAWVGNERRSEPELRVQAELERTWQLPVDELMRRFVELQLAPGVEPPPPPPGPTPPWMAKRPAGIKALTAAFADYKIDLEALRAFPGPVYYTLGGRSNPDYYGAMARRLGEMFADHALDTFTERHHFDPRTARSPSASRPGCSSSGSGSRPRLVRRSDNDFRGRESTVEPRSTATISPGRERRASRAEGEGHSDSTACAEHACSLTN